MNRSDLQQLSEERVQDARTLVAAGRWSGAYYLAGYALECALKSCIVGRIERRPGIVFTERKFSENCWTHDIERLVKQADLGSERVKAAAANSELEANWGIVKDWTEESRYKQSSESRTNEFLKALTDPIDGVLPWVKQYW